MLGAVGLLPELQVLETQRDVFDRTGKRPLFSTRTWYSRLAILSYLRSSPLAKHSEFPATHGQLCCANRTFAMRMLENSAVGFGWVSITRAISEHREHQNRLQGILISYGGHESPHGAQQSVITIVFNLFAMAA